MKADLVEYYEGDKPMRFMYETKDGYRFTPEQWRMMQFMDRLEKKIDKFFTKD